MEEKDLEQLACLAVRYLAAYGDRHLVEYLQEAAVVPLDGDAVVKMVVDRINRETGETGSNPILV